MILRIPSYYKEFQCIADKCQDSCCIGWEIDIDEDTFDYYQSIEGPLGARLKKHMITEDEVNSFTLEENGWCPFLNKEKLCDICIALGEEGLSEVCTEYPRFTVEYGNVREKALCLSCEEVGRILFSKEEKITLEEVEIQEDVLDVVECPGFQSPIEDIRDHAMELLQNREKDIKERVRDFLLYCEREQGVAEENFKETDKEETNRYSYFLQRINCYRELEVLNQEWTDTLEGMASFFAEHDYETCLQQYEKAIADRSYEYEQLLVYFTFRYFTKAWYDGNILAKAQLAAVSYLVIRDMDVVRYFENGETFTFADRIDTARIYAKEVEHSEENLELLEDAFSFEEFFHVESLLNQL